MIKSYRESINPPYSKKDLPALLGTLLLLIGLPLIFLAASQLQDIRQHAATGNEVVFTDSAGNTITQTTSASVGVKLSSPSWGTPPANATPTPIQSGPTPTSPIQAGGTYEGVPICPTHDPYKWHDLVERNADGSIRCTYTHEHHDDPNTVNDIFGPPGAWFGLSGQSISYPWQTFKFTTPAGVDYPYPPDPNDPAMMENALKHNGYKWTVKRDMPCEPARAGISQNDGCFISFRVLAHDMGTVADSTARFHSFSAEVLVEGKNANGVPVRGIIRAGGWMDTGHLAVRVSNALGIVTCPSLPTNPPNFPSATYPCGGSTHRTAIAPQYECQGCPSNWYATHGGIISVAPRLEDFGPTDPNDPFMQLFWPASFMSNNSIGGLEIMAAETRYSMLNQYQDANGIINFKGYLDRHGHGDSGGDGFITTCTAPSVDCVPVVIQNVPTSFYGLVNSGPGRGAEHDIMSPVTGKSLIAFPN